MAAMGASRVAHADESVWAMAVRAEDKENEPEIAAAVEPSTTPMDAAPGLAESPHDATPVADVRKPTTTSPTSRASTVRTRKSSKQLKSYDENGFPVYNIPRSTSWEKLEDAELNGKKSARGNDKLKRKTSKGAIDALNPEAYTPENWIHRDKLAQIESKELVDIGLRMAGGGSRSGAPSRARSHRTAKSSIDAAENGLDGEEAFHDAHQQLPVKKMRTKSPAPHEVLNESDELVNTARSDSSSRPGTSSRLPVAAADLPYESPRGGDGEDGHGRSGSRELSKQKQRLRSQSGGRELVQPEVESPSASTSSAKRATSKSRGPPSAARKASAAGLGNTNGRTHGSSDSSSSPGRPGTSGGSRPRTRSGPPNPINRPEGDPPWIVDSFKPDPRLPPDQQMLPTHARKMAELQREAEERARQEAIERAQQQAAARQKEQEEYILLESADSHTDLANKRNSHISVQGRSVNGEVGLADDRRQSKRDSGQWPLRTPTPDQQMSRLQHNTAGHESPPVIDTNWSHRRNGTIDSVALNGPGSPHGHYSLTPAIHSAEDQQKAYENQQHRLSQRSRLSQNTVGGHVRQLSDQEWKENAAQAPVHQPVTLDPRKQERGHQHQQPPKEKTPGCLGCCTVM